MILWIRGLKTHTIWESDNRGKQGSLTSDKNVCALFCAPTCNKYSYTYNANLKERQRNILSIKYTKVYPNNGKRDTETYCLQDYETCYRWIHTKDFLWNCKTLGILRPYLKLDRDKRCAMIQIRLYDVLEMNLFCKRTNLTIKLTLFTSVERHFGGCLITGTAIIHYRKRGHPPKQVENERFLQNSWCFRPDESPRPAVLYLPYQLGKWKIGQYLLFSCLGIRGDSGPLSLGVHACCWTVTHLSRHQGRHWPRSHGNIHDDLSQEKRWLVGFI